MTTALVVRRTVFGLLVAASLYAFLTPATPDGAPEGSDKVAHALIFATLTVVGWWAGVRLPLLALGLGGYAVLTEVLQAILPLGRRGDPADLVANAVGIGIGLVLAAVLALSRAVRRTGRPAGRPGRPAPSRRRG